MYIAMAMMFVGIFIGYLLSRKRAVFTFLGKLNSFIIYLLLFVMGLSIGANELIMSNLATLGLRGILIGIGATLGSAVASYWVYQRWFKKGEEQA